MIENYWTWSLILNFKNQLIDAKSSKVQWAVGHFDELLWPIHF